MILDSCFTLTGLLQLLRDQMCKKIKLLSACFIAILTINANAEIHNNVFRPTVVKIKNGRVLKNTITQRQPFLK